MLWNWLHPQWPRFHWDDQEIARLEAEFLKLGGMLAGVLRYMDSEDRANLEADLLTSEAMDTSLIEGEILTRSSVQSSIRGLLGLDAGSSRATPAEVGISRMTVDVRRTFADQLDESRLHAWHEALMSGRFDVSAGRYRIHPDPMQIVSGSLSRPKVHFEAVPSAQVRGEMEVFVAWFNASEQAVKPLSRAGIAHLHFESIHPYEDGNGRIGRAISEKALNQGIGEPVGILLSSEIESRRRQYYAELEKASQGLDATRWLVWFGETVIAAQHRSLAWIEFVVQKARVLNSLRGRLNVRQEKALLRIFREGPTGFQGGLSAANYMKITGASPATATRDLGELVEWGALRRVGEKKGARYLLAENTSQRSFQ